MQRRTQPSSGHSAACASFKPHLHASFLAFAMSAGGETPERGGNHAATHHQELLGAKPRGETWSAAPHTAPSSRRRAAPLSSSCWQPWFPKRSSGAEGGRAQRCRHLQELHALPGATRGRRTHGLLSPPPIHPWLLPALLERPPAPPFPPQTLHPAPPPLPSRPHQPLVGLRCAHNPHSTRHSDGALTPNA